MEEMEMLIKQIIDDCLVLLNNSINYTPNKFVIRVILNEFIDMYEKKPEVMRFHYHKPAELLERINDLRAEYNQGKVKFEYPEFKTNVDFAFEPKHFITEDEKDWLLLSGSGVVGGKFRIQGFFKQDHNAKEKADFHTKNRYFIKIQLFFTL